MEKLHIVQMHVRPIKKVKNKKLGMGPAIISGSATDL